MQGSWAVRRATIDDAEAIAHVHIDAYEASLGGVVDRAVLDRANARRHPMWVALLSEPPEGQAVFVHDDDGVTGFVSTGPSRGRDVSADEGEVYALFVDPSRWGTGVGGSLLERAVEHLRSLGLQEAKLWVLDENDRARRFYEAREWSDLGEVREDERGRFFRYGRRL
jgi:GNAT superfamily N-acetyltransferase